MTLTMLSLDQMLVLLFVGAVLIFVFGLRVAFGPERRNRIAALQRMQALSGVRSSPEAETLVRSRTETPKGVALPFIGNPDLALARAGVEMSGRTFLALCAIATLAVGSLAATALGPLPGAALGLGLGALLPVSILRHRHQRRVQAFTAQLPDALELMMRGLRVGHPVSVTIGNVARTMPDPIGEEFRILADQIAHGDYLTDAFADMAERLDQEDMDYLSVSLSIQHGTGGNLADMLGTLSKVIRDRMMMRRRVKAISSEGRMSALLLSALPVLIYVVTSITAPDYYGGVRDDPLFMPIAIIVVGLVVANGLVLRKLATFNI